MDIEEGILSSLPSRIEGRTHAPSLSRAGSDLEKRNKMALASFYGGSAFTRAYVAYVHAITHNMGGLYGRPARPGKRDHPAPGSPVRYQENTLGGKADRLSKPVRVILLTDRECPHQQF